MQYESTQKSFQTAKIMLPTLLFIQFAANTHFIMPVEKDVVWSIARPVGSTLFEAAFHQISPTNKSFSARTRVDLHPTNLLAHTIESVSTQQPQLLLVTASLPKRNSLVRDGGGSMAISPNWPSGAMYRAFTATNITQPLSNWTLPTTGASTGGVFYVTDQSAANISQRFYRVVTS